MGNDFVFSGVEIHEVENVHLIIIRLSEVVDILFTNITFLVSISILPISDIYNPSLVRLYVF